MNDFFQENKKILFIMIGALAVFAVVLTLLIVRPLTLDLKKEKQNVALERDETKILQAQIDNYSDDTIHIDLEQLLLEKKVPSERKIDEYILSLHQLEQYANSSFESIRFSYDSSLNVIEEEDSKDNESEVSDEAEIQLEESELEQTTDEQLTEEIESAPIFLTEMPEQLEVVTVTVTALVPSFEDVVDLVRAIEDQDRISIVSRMSTVVQTEEEELFNQEQELIALEIDVSTFYYGD